MAEEAKKEAAPETQASQPKHGGFGWIPWFLVLFPFIYFLSIGPVLKVSRHTRAYHFTRHAYNPLLACAYHCPPLQTCLNQYLQVWGVRGLTYPSHVY